MARERRQGLAADTGPPAFCPCFVTPSQLGSAWGGAENGAKRPKMGRKSLLLKILESNPFIINNLDPVLNSINDCKQTT